MKYLWVLCITLLYSFMAAIQITIKKTKTKNEDSGIMNPLFVKRTEFLLAACKLNPVGILKCIISEVE